MLPAGVVLAASVGHLQQIDAHVGIVRATLGAKFSSFSVFATLIKVEVTPMGLLKFKSPIWVTLMILEVRNGYPNCVKGSKWCQTDAKRVHSSFPREPLGVINCKSSSLVDLLKLRGSTEDSLAQKRYPELAK